jgi:hypothetical protein
MMCIFTATIKNDAQKFIQISFCKSSQVNLKIIEHFHFWKFEICNSMKIMANVQVLADF